MTAESLKSLPDRMESTSNLQQSKTLGSYSKFIGGFALDYGPNFAGETIDAVSSVAQFTQSVASKITRTSLA